MSIIIRYDDPFSCNRCGSKNSTIIKDKMEYTVTEYETSCSVCGFKDYWCTGFFESRVEGFNNSKKYMTNNPNILQKGDER